MKKIKILSLILAVLMLGSTVLLFASCSGEDGDYDISSKVIDVDLSGYALIYGDSQNGGSYTNTFRNQMDLLAKKLAIATGVTFKATSMARADKDASAKEIMVGLTTRPESQAALSEIEGEGFIIKVLSNKIVIVGTNNVFTMMGVNYFADKYLKGTTTSKTLTVNESVNASNIASMVLTDSSKNAKGDEADAYTYVYSSLIGLRPSAYISVSTNPKTSTYEEYEQVMIKNISDQLSKVTKLGNKYFPVETDKETYAKEVLIGRTNRPESVAALNSIEANEFVISTDGQKVVVNAWCEAALRYAGAAYLDLMTEGTVKADGVTRVVIPENFRLTGTAKTEYVMDFPKPEGEGISLYNTMDANDGALQFLYTGSGVNETSYKAYCDKLKAEGYTVYQQTESEGSIFTFFTNKAEDIALYVAFNAFAHQNDFGDYNWTVSKQIDSQVIDVYKYDPCIRIVSSTIEDAQLPNQTLLNEKQSYTKVTDSMITTMPIYSKAVGLSYVVTLEDGRFVVFDGGGVNENGGTEHEILWETLTALYKTFNDGKEPTSQDPIRIAAWVLTHAHWDHYYAFQNLAKKYGSTGKLKVDYMVANIPGEESVYTQNEIAVCMTPEGVKSLQSSIKGGFEYIKVHTGMKFYLANLEIEVLTTWEDLNPIVSNTSNDSNTVLRFTMTNKNAPKAEPVTMIWTGDANRAQSRFMCATYGTALKADMVSVAHHGNAGCEVDFYDMVQPTVIWWPHNADAAARYLNRSNKNEGWQYEVDQFFFYNLASVQYVYTSGVRGGTAGGRDFFTTLVLTKDGPDFDNIFDVVSGQKLDYAPADTINACMKK